ncbi:MAG: UDP-N-acetylglucosamine 2-epimerase, partial [Chlorobium sp.]|nr:UDP-N-acetylglucosamine 2-epimerase [Chlorobium sp.]
IDEYVMLNPKRSVAFTSMGQLRYLSAMKLASVVIGNSSSGIIEAPSFGVPTVNIGDRQRGRVRTASVISCPVETGLIVVAIKKGLSMDFMVQSKNIENPYLKTGTTTNILTQINNCFSNGFKLKKYYEVSPNDKN